MRAENPREPEPDGKADEREGEGHEGHEGQPAENRITISDVERPEEEEEDDRAAGNCGGDTITCFGLEVTLPGHLKVQTLMLRPCIRQHGMEYH